MKKKLQVTRGRNRPNQGMITWCLPLLRVKLMQSIAPGAYRVAADPDNGDAADPAVFSERHMVVFQF
jgi:hypothetical protein